MKLPALPWNPMPFMEEIILEKQVEERAPDYVRKLKAGLAYFATWCASQDIEHPEEVTRHHLLQYQAWVNRQEWARSYKSQQLKYVRIWFRWLESCRYITGEDRYNVPIPVIAKTPNPLSDDALALLFETHRRSAFQISPFFYHRTEVILTLLYSWGLRIHELQALNVTGMDVRLESVICRNKGGGTKSLPYSPAMKEIVMRWLNARTKYAKVGEDALIIDQEGKRLSLNGIRKVIKQLSTKAGIEVHPHQLRDTCGTHLLDSDVAVERVMKVLGHSKREQTLAYSRVNDHKVAESHQKAMDPRLNALLPSSTPPRVVSPPGVNNVR